MIIAAIIFIAIRIESILDTTTGVAVSFSLSDSRFRDDHLALPYMIGTSSDSNRTKHHLRRQLAIIFYTDKTPSPIQVKVYAYAQYESLVPATTATTATPATPSNSHV
ncbi:11018_t:CDS:2 [Funneliformis mosseae]|uniref:11018_t:CDS:1 n=1 Tax=Funneliformis mosseae TaxID=27381 RepID=A0A9N9B905_FUNMO|nr:11018_t:CDS:2 [Funneliformis mosseae]